MLPLVVGTPERLFATLHRRMMDVGYEPAPWASLDADGFSDEARERARAAWAARASAEYRSMVVFGEMIARLPEAGLPLEVSAAASRLLQDEARHTELCLQLAERLGGTRGSEVAPRDLCLADASLSARYFVARWTASMFCVGESASVGVLGELVHGATDPCVRAVLRTLLRDERLHDRFGWALARTVLPALTEDERETLGVDLAFTFRHYEDLHAGSARDDEAPAATVPPVTPNLGVVSREATARGFYARIDRVILPSLAALGAPAYEAWALRHEARLG